LPGTLVLLLALFTPVRSPAQLQLAAELFEEGNWTASATECTRLVLRGEDPADAGALRTLAEFRLGRVERDAVEKSAALPDLAPRILALLQQELDRGSVKRGFGRKLLSWSGRPAAWVVSLYQSQVAPAIGSRCSLHPSCSTYARQALQKHGILGIAMYTDRAVREPTVVGRRERQVRIRGRRKDADPVEDHDWWMGGEREAESGKREAE